MEKLLSFSVIFAVVTGGFCCSEPEVTSTSFTTQDATIVAYIAFISDFTVKCSSGEIGNLYAEVNGNIAPVSIVGSDKYQVSWTEDTNSARAGNKLIKLFDEEGFTAYRKAARAGEDVSAVPVLTTVVLYYPGAFNGPWLKSEFIATILSLIVAYYAIASRAKVVS